MRTSLWKVGLLAAAMMSCTQEGADSNERASGAAAAAHVLSDVPELTLGGSESGHVGGRQIDVYSMVLRAGDRITLRKVAQGDLVPGFTLFFGYSTKQSSASFTAELTTLAKTYVIAETGAYYVVVRAYQDEGEGDYILSARCTGGPCAGEPGPVEPLDAWQSGQCIRLARECAMGRMATGAGPVQGPAVFQSCLSEVRIDQSSPACNAACDGENGDELCAHVIETVLPFYVGKSSACREAFGSCMDDCAESGADGEDAGSEDLAYSSEAMCLYNGYNGDCDINYARILTTCGGAVDPDSDEACHAHCEATFGVWTDDLDTICDEECPE